jgi:hypothetical protein
MSLILLRMSGIGLGGRKGRDGKMEDAPKGDLLSDAAVPLEQIAVHCTQCL